MRILLTTKLPLALPIIYYERFVHIQHTSKAEALLLRRVAAASPPARDFTSMPATTEHLFHFCAR